jgi:pimeloyl-ACP methyl ester carboxylesterase
MKRKFTIDIDQTTLTDLQQRLDETRWPDEFEGSEWKFGSNLAFMKKLTNYWRQTFDWKKQEAYLNSFENFKSTVDGVGLHYLHQKGEGTIRIPLLLIHGWPDSFIRFLKLIPLLTKADQHDISFDVIVPSLPGHGFSDIPTEKGMNSTRMAKLCADLMTEELGYKKFIVHGGDVGSEVAEQLALYHADSLLGVHLTDIPYHHIIEASPDDLTNEEKKYLEKITHWQMTEGAYNMIQSTKPQTLAYAVNDSPVGLAAWIVEKFHNWSDNGGDIESCFTKDELLTNITIYWVTQTINASFRRYNEAMIDMMQSKYNPLQKLNPLNKTGSKTEVPTGVAQFTTDYLPPKDFAKKFFNIVRWTELPKGGHFAALEQPALLAKEIRLFCNNLTTNH